MDHIYPTKDYKVYTIKDEVQKLKSSVTGCGLPLKFDDIAETEIPHNRLAETCIDLCKSYADYGDEVQNSTPGPFATFPEEGLQLNFVKMMQKENFKFKEPRVRETTLHNPEVNENKSKDLELFSDSVITVRFYEPYQYLPSVKNQPRFHLEYLVLGSNFLTDLRDKFYCPCNYGPFHDISGNPNEVVEPEFNAPNPGFFFIYDTFHNDTRNPLNPDYSETVHQWLKRFDYIRQFKTKTMQDTKFEDLNIRIGDPCVYQHQGACEHVFCITSVDLIDNSTSLLRSDYPLLSSSNRKRSTLCDICNKIDANFLVTNCALHVKDPMKLCYNCFLGFHYEKDGITKTCSFNAYRIYNVRANSQ